MPNGQSLVEQVARFEDGFRSVPAMAAVRESLPSLPIMASTRLQLDLLLNDPVIDLKGVAEVVLSDPGATLQILRLIGEEFPNLDDRPKRIEDCIVTLNLTRCYQTICASQTPHSGPHVAEWQRCRRLAECARELATGVDSIAPEEAYLAGLLSSLGTFPQLLGWKEAKSLSSEFETLGVMLAYHWNLPQCVLLAIQDQHDLGSSSKWKDLLLLAHKLLEQRGSEQVD